MFLNHFDPADISPDLLVDREEDVAWLRSNFESYFDAIEQHTLEPAARRIVGLTGEKGAGKSIVAAKVVQELRKKYSGSTLFASVDCRSANGARGVVARIASSLLAEIAEFTPVVAAAGTPFPAWLLPLTSVLSNVAHADSANRKTLRQQMSLHKTALKVGGQLTQRALSAEFQLSFEQELRASDAFETTVNFDVDRVMELAAKLFQDIRNAGMRVFLLVDNVDELQHEYWDEGRRSSTLATVKSVLKLTEAPIAVLLCMRTYFQGVLPRVAGQPHSLGRLSEAWLLEIIERRMNLEAEPVRRGLLADDAQAIIKTLAARAATPLALLSWVKWVTERAPGFAGTIEAHAERWRGASYVDFKKVVEATLELFAKQQAAGVSAVSTEELLAAIGGDPHAMRYLQTTELILPRDFWEPTHFVLDPSAAWIMKPRP